jgi:hypothetical protein
MHAFDSRRRGKVTQPVPCGIRALMSLKNETAFFAGKKTASVYHFP